MSFISRSGARDEYYVAAEELTAPSRRGGLAPIAMLDGMELTQAQFIGGLRAIDALPEEQRWNALSQTLALQAYAADAGLLPTEVASAAIAARATAMYKRQALHDPEATHDPAHLIAVAAVADLSSDDSGIVFDADRYRELVEFIVQLPF